MGASSDKNSPIISDKTGTIICGAQCIKVASTSAKTVALMTPKSEGPEPSCNATLNWRRYCRLKGLTMIRRCGASVPIRPRADAASMSFLPGTKRIDCGRPRTPSARGYTAMPSRHEVAGPQSDNRAEPLTPRVRARKRRARPPRWFVSGAPRPAPVHRPRCRARCSR